MSHASQDFTLMSFENWMILVGVIVIVGIAVLTARF